MSEYLIHHGILGQKWGIRRYQNKDGSLTEEGRKRLGIDKYEKDHDSDINLKKRTKASRVASGKKVVDALLEEVGSQKVSEMSRITDLPLHLSLHYMGQAIPSPMLNTPAIY